MSSPFMVMYQLDGEWLASSRTSDSINPTMMMRKSKVAIVHSSSSYC